MFILNNILYCRIKSCWQKDRQPIQSCFFLRDLLLAKGVFLYNNGSCFTRNLIKAFTFLHSEGVLLGNGEKISIYNVGTSIVYTFNGYTLSLDNILYKLTVTTNLILVNKMYANNDIFIEFDSFGFYVNDIHLRR